MKEPIKDVINFYLAGKRLSSFDLVFYEKLGQAPFLNPVFYQLLTTFTVLTEEHLVPIFVNDRHLFIAEQEPSKMINVYESADLDIPPDGGQSILLYQTAQYPLTVEQQVKKTNFIQKISELDIQLTPGSANSTFSTLGEIVNIWLVKLDN
ncbi:hypothetical protein [Enterococcus ureasiticus]|uniref:Uncharacterized protein n=1 Tax=Enterococcus ureasiticus TaxID=903984 RepID=A0A1E5G8H4_9ENTE|nr:hypothetical protein [Enterococcus ureasiticus]OEG09006.1 hypothetical protein BCR21_15640 [Enterococcus ureasiticus]